MHHHAPGEVEVVSASVVRTVHRLRVLECCELRWPGGPVKPPRNHRMDGSYAGKSKTDAWKGQNNGKHMEVGTGLLTSFIAHTLS